MTSLNTGEILMCTLSLSAAAVIICVAACGNPILLARYCVPRARVPSDAEERHRSRFSKWLSNLNILGYVFDMTSYREYLRLRRENNERMLLDEQIRRLEQLAESEMELRARIDNGDDSRETAVELSRVGRFRYALAMRTREERRRRRMVLWQQFIEADEQAEIEEEEGAAAHFKHTLSLDEKRRVLDQALEYRRYKAVHVPTKGESGGGGSNGDSNRKDGSTNHNSPIKKKKVDIVAAMNSSIRSRVSERTSAASVDEETGDPDGRNEPYKIASDKMCSICLDEYEDGEMLAMRSERCLHMFHRDCLQQWLTARRADCCPVCRSDILTEGEWKDVHSKNTSTENDASQNEGGAIRSGDEDEVGDNDEEVPQVHLDEEMNRKESSQL